MRNSLKILRLEGLKICLTVCVASVAMSGYRTSAHFTIHLGYIRENLPI